MKRSPYVPLAAGERGRLPRSGDWWQGTQELRQAFVEHEGLKPMVGV